MASFVERNVRIDSIKLKDVVEKNETIWKIADTLLRVMYEKTSPMLIAPLPGNSGAEANQFRRSSVSGYFF